MEYYVAIKELSKGTDARQLKRTGQKDRRFLCDGEQVGERTARAHLRRKAKIT